MHDKYLRFMARATGKTEEQIDEDLWWDKWFSPQVRCVVFGVFGTVVVLRPGQCWPLSRH